MPEFKEYGFDDKKETSEGGSKKKKLKIKNKWFFIGLILVIIFVIFQKIKNSNQSAESGYYATPLGYSGYPDSIDGAIAVDNSYTDSALDTMGKEFSSALDSIYKETDTTIKNLENSFNNEIKGYESIIDDMGSQLDNMSNKYNEVIEVVDKQTETINTQSIISQMKENSDRALLTSNQAEKDYLHEQNVKLADSIGATFNASDGYYYKNGTRLYSTALQSEKTYSSGSSSKPTSSTSSTSSTTNKSSVIAQMQSNSAQWHTSTQSQKDALYKQNQELGKSIGLTYNSSTGTWHNADGSRAY